MREEGKMGGRGNVEFGKRGLTVVIRGVSRLVIVERAI